MEGSSLDKNKKNPGLIDPLNRDEIINAKNLIKDIDSEINKSLVDLKNEILSPELTEVTKSYIERLKKLRKKFEDGIKILQEAEREMKKILTTTRPEQLR